MCAVTPRNWIKNCRCLVLSWVLEGVVVAGSLFCHDYLKRGTSTQSIGFYHSLRR